MTKSTKRTQSDSTVIWYIAGVLWPLFGKKLFLKRFK
jgi:hypothetical protein